MFQYFPTNYVWNLSVNIAMNTGGQIGEIDQICKPLVEVSRQGDDAGTEMFYASWVAKADDLVEYANDDEAAGHGWTAAGKLARASMYYLVAERMQHVHYEPRKQAYAKAMATFRRAVELGDENCEFVEVPYGDSAFPALFVRGTGEGPRPAMVYVQGLDSMKEMVYRVGIAQQLARRGISTLIVDQPGTGEALRYRGLHGVYDAEQWGTPAYEALAERDDVDPSRVGVMGWSLGGYYAPRVAAYEPRYSLCAVWGANYDWGELQKRRLANEGDRPVPHYWEHVQWVFDKPSLEEFMAWAPRMNLREAVTRIRVPFLVTHGENDGQIPMEYAVAQFEGAVNSPDKEFKVFTADEGGASHAGADNEAVPVAYLADWVAEHL